MAAARAGAAAAAATAVAGVSAAWCLLRSPCTQSRHTPRHWCQCHAPERRRGAVDAPRGYHADSAVHSQTCSTSPTAVHSCPQLSTVVYIYSCPYLPYTPHTPLIHPSYTPHTPLHPSYTPRAPRPCGKQPARPIVCAPCVAKSLHARRALLQQLQQQHDAGADTRQLFSSTRAVSDRKCTLNTRDTLNTP